MGQTSPEAGTLVLAHGRVASAEVEREARREAKGLEASAGPSQCPDHEEGPGAHGYVGLV